MLWQIQGNDPLSPDTILYLLPEDQVREDFDIRSDCNSEIFEGKINTAGASSFDQYDVLHIQSSEDCLPTSTSPTTFLDIGIDQDGNQRNVYEFITSVNKPILSLQVIGSLIDSDGGSIPYLEYQLEIHGDDTNPPADMYQTVVGEGYSQSFKQSVEAKKGMKSGILKFVISN